VNACFALAYKTKMLRDPHCFGAKYGLVFFYTTVKLFATGGYGWSEV